MVQPAIGRGYQIVDLTADDENDDSSDDGFDSHSAHSISGLNHNGLDFDFDELDANLFAHAEIDNPDTIDLTAIPDIDIPPEHSRDIFEDPVPTVVAGDAELITEAVCLQLVLDVFPDVSVDHVSTMIQERTCDLTRTKEHSERIVNELLEGNYPKQAEATSKKRKREESQGVSDFEDGKRTVGAIEHLDA